MNTNFDNTGCPGGGFSPPNRPSFVPSYVLNWKPTQVVSNHNLLIDNPSHMDELVQQRLLIKIKKYAIFTL